VEQAAPAGWDVKGERKLVAFDAPGHLQRQTAPGRDGFQGLQATGFKGL
jgi:hypothetical protein